MAESDSIEYSLGKYRMINGEIYRQKATAAIKKYLCCNKQYMVVHYKKQEVHTMATKTANVTARIQPNIKEQAEAILDRLGIPVSVFIDMTYRQVIMRDGVPFSLDIPDKLVTRDTTTQAEFDMMMQTGLAQAKKNDSVSVDEAFSQLKSKI